MKAIAIVNLPDCCYHCKFNIIDGDIHDCYICHKKFERDNQMIRQEWCPLKPVQSLKSGGKDYIIYERQFLYDNLEREIEMIRKGKEIYESNTD